MSEQNISNSDLIEHVTHIVAAYVSKNAISSNDLPDLMSSVHSSLKDLTTNAPTAQRPEPAVPIKKSVTDAYIICLEDGKKLKMLKRYLRTRYDMTPDEYRARWELPADYPMVAPEYAKRRSAFAKEIGLGRKP